MADLEMIFPYKKILLRPTDIIKFTLTAVRKEKKKQCFLFLLLN